MTEGEVTSKKIQFSRGAGNENFALLRSRKTFCRAGSRGNVINGGGDEKVEKRGRKSRFIAIRGMYRVSFGHFF